MARSAWPVATAILFQELIATTAISTWATPSSPRARTASSQTGSETPRSAMRVASSVTASAAVSLVIGCQSPGVRVTGQNEPCSNLMQYDRGLVKASYGRRGLVATVVSGAGQRLRAGDTVELKAP